MSADKPEVDRESKLFRDIIGRVQKIHYNKSGFTICRVEIIECVSNPAAKGMTIVCKGGFSPVLIGCLYTIQGMLSKYENSKPKHGKPISEWQLLVSFWKQQGNQEKDALVAFLTQECEGIGPMRAMDLWDAFGKNTLDTLRDSPDKVAVIVKGIPLSRAHAISETIKANEAMFRFKEYLYGIGLTQGLAAKLYAFYGIETEKAVKERTFELSEVDGIGFKTCCVIADKIGIPKERQDRVRAGILYTVNELMQSKGCTCLETKIVTREAGSVLDVDHSVIREQLAWLIKEGKLLPDTCTFDDKLFDRSDEHPEESMDEAVEQYFGDDVADTALLKNGTNWRRLKASLNRTMEADKPVDSILAGTPVKLPAVERPFRSAVSTLPIEMEEDHGSMHWRGQGCQGRNSSKGTLQVADSQSANTSDAGLVVEVTPPPLPQLEEFELILDDGIEACRDDFE